MLGSLFLSKNQMRPRFETFGSELNDAILSPSMTNIFDFPIALISSKGEFHQNREKLAQEMRLLHERYGSLPMPIVYIFGDTVYKNTETLDRELARAKVSWKAKYDAILDELEHDQQGLKEVVVSWEKVKSDESYREIKKFVDLVFDVTLNLEKLQQAFPGVQDSSVLERLLAEVQSLHLLDNLEAITEEFKKKNLVKVMKKEKQEKGKSKKKQELMSSLLELVTDQEISFDTALLGLNKRTNQAKQTADLFLKQTLAFIKEEYAVFMNLSLPRTVAEMSAKCGLSGDGEDLIRPILHYPITSTQGSRLIFDTFRQVESKYIEYCSQLHLPVIDSPVFIVDVVVPDKLLDQANQKACSENEEQKSDLSNHLKEPLQETLMPQDSSLNTSAQSAVTPFSFYQPPLISLEIKETAQKIIALIHEACLPFSERMPVDTIIKYSNGITCDILVKTVLDFQHSSYIPTWEKKQNSIVSLIERAIYRVQTDKIEITTNIHYLDYDISLSMKLPQPSLNFSG